MNTLKVDCFKDLRSIPVDYFMKMVLTEFNAEMNQWLQRFNSIVNRNKNGRLVCVSHLLYISQRMRKHAVILSSLSVTNA